MTALNTPRNTPERLGDVFGFPVAAGAVIHQGALVMLDGGYAAPGAPGAGKIAAGRAEWSVDNTAGAAGARLVEVRRGVFRFENDSATPIEQTDIGADAYILDDQTVTGDSSGASRAGPVVAIDQAGVWVLIGLGY
jgi:hypothetical protein